MTTISVDYQRLEESSSDQDETVSLCDLPVNLTNQDNETTKDEGKSIQDGEEFDFGTLKFDMCAADEVFFQGQILPSYPPRQVHTNVECPRPETKNPIRIMSRSFSSSRFTFTSTSSNTSSRSSSNRSQQSSNCPRMENNPSVQSQYPKPQIKPSGCRKTFAWEIFRTGLLRTPENDLHELKIHSMGNKGTTRKNSCSLNYKMCKNQRLYERRMPLSGCKCSVETISLNYKGVKRKENTKHVVIEEKMNALEIKQKKKDKQEMSRNRTCEWLKGLSWHVEVRLIS